MTLAEITTAVLAVVEDYAVYISAGVIFGLALFAVRALIKRTR